MTDPWLYAEFGRRVAARRKAKGWTQDDLARRIDMSRASVANMETGRQRAPIHVVYRLAKVLDCTPIDLVPPPKRAAVKPRDWLTLPKPRGRPP